MKIYPAGPRAPTPKAPRGREPRRRETATKAIHPMTSDSVMNLRARSRSFGFSALLYAANLPMFHLAFHFLFAENRAKGDMDDGADQAAEAGARLHREFRGRERILSELRRDRQRAGTGVARDRPQTHHRTRD